MHDQPSQKMDYICIGSKWTPRAVLDDIWMTFDIWNSSTESRFKCHLNFCSAYAVNVKNIKRFQMSSASLDVCWFIVLIATGDIWMTFDIWNSSTESRFKCHLNLCSVYAVNIKNIKRFQMSSVSLDVCWFIVLIAA